MALIYIWFVFLLVSFRENTVVVFFMVLGMTIIGNFRPIGLVSLDNE
jgi:hypothetical protein